MPASAQTSAESHPDTWSESDTKSAAVAGNFAPPLPPTPSPPPHASAPESSGDPDDPSHEIKHLLPPQSCHFSPTIREAVVQALKSPTRPPDPSPPSQFFQPSATPSIPTEENCTDHWSTSWLAPLVKGVDGSQSPPRQEPHATSLVVSESSASSRYPTPHPAPPQSRPTRPKTLYPTPQPPRSGPASFRATKPPV